MTKQRRIDLIMYNCLRNEPQTYFIEEGDNCREVDRKTIFDTIAHYYKLACIGKIELSEGYYFNSNSHLTIKSLYITEQ